MPTITQRGSSIGSCAVACSLRAIFFTGLLIAAARAQTTRPMPPSDGFQVNIDWVVPVTYSDDYVTFGSLLTPDHPAPAGGWPVVVFVHPMGASRGFDVEFQMIVASQGYAVWSYDVRAQGQAALSNVGHANAGSTVWGSAERLDLAEQITFLAESAMFAGVVYASRVAVVGHSQGAGHAWFAAALSEKQVSAPGRPSLVFPEVACVAAFGLVADPIDDWLRGGSLFSSWLVSAIDPNFTAVPMHEGFIEQARAAFLNQDPVSLHASLQVGHHPELPSLAQSVVPVLYSHAYRDLVNNCLSGIETLEEREGLRRVLLGGVGHNVPLNVPELRFRRATTLRWFHRYLWEEMNDVDLEVENVLHRLPETKIVANNTQRGWARTPVADLRPADDAKKLFLHGDRGLTDEPPRTPGTASVEQVLQPTAAGFSPALYLNDPAVRELGNVLTACPLHDLVYERRITSEQQMSRSGLLHLTVVPHQPAWQLTATLTLQYGHMSHEVVLATNTLGSRTSRSMVPEVHELRLPPIAVRLPVGAIVRLHVRNLALRESPMLLGLDVVPMFEDFRVDILEGPEEDYASWLELPLEPVSVELVADRALMTITEPMPITLKVHGGAARAHHVYIGMVGMSGQSPSTPYYGTLLPVEFDPLVAQTLGSTKGMLMGGIGPLNAQGSASMHFDMSGMPVLGLLQNGNQLTFGAFVWDFSGHSGDASNAWDIYLF